MSRVHSAVERAGLLDRAHHTAETAHHELSKAHTILIELDPGTAALMGIAIPKLNRVLNRMKQT